MNSIIGESCVRVDVLEKAIGQASFIDDVSFTGMLYGKVLRSPYAHARIKSVNLEKARKLPGVHAVITGRDFPSLPGEAIINAGGVRTYSLPINPPRY